MVLEIRPVGRKTPGDGRLEITEQTAQRLLILSSSFPVTMGEAADTVAVQAMSCTCSQGGDVAGHSHHFLQSPLFKTLTANRTAVIELVDGPAIVISVPYDE